MFPLTSCGGVFLRPPTPSIGLAATSNVLPSGQGSPASAAAAALAPTTSTRLQSAYTGGLAAGLCHDHIHMLGSA